jgi:hypothetical protein
MPRTAEFRIMNYELRRTLGPRWSLGSSLRFEGLRCATRAGKGENFSVVSGQAIIKLIK